MLCQSLLSVKNKTFVGCSFPTACSSLTLLHSERPKLYTILAFLIAVGLRGKNVVDPKRFKEYNNLA